MSKEPAKPVTMNFPVSLWDSLNDLGEMLGYEDARGIHSPMIREIVSAVVLKWRQSPYICHSARHVVFITKNGEVFYWLLQEIQLHGRRKKLPCILEMKPEKRYDFLMRRDAKIEEAEWFRSRWLLNLFTAWQGRGSSSNLLDCYTDRTGTISKSADLEIDQGPNRFVTREMVIGLQDYVQWRGCPASPGAELSFDRVDLPVDIPTRGLKISVVMDADIYRKTDFASEEEIPLLAMEFRNREGARFEDLSISRDPENPIAEECSGRCTGKARSVKASQMFQRIVELKQRISTLTEISVAGLTYVSKEERQKVDSVLSLPERFLFYELDWPSPQHGIEICVGWEKPVAVEGR